MATFDSSKHDIPTLVAKLRDQRFDGYQPEQLAQVVEKFRDGAGTAGITDAVEALKSISGALADTEQALRTQLKALGVEWQSQAGGQASSVVARQAGFSGEATAKVDHAAQMMFEQAEAFTRTRNKLPTPEDLRKAGGYNFGDTVFSLFGFETDHAADVRTAAEASAQAVDALNAYAHDSGNYLGSTSTVEAPEPVELLSAPGTGVTAGLGGATAPVPSLPEDAPTQAQGTKGVSPAPAPVADPPTPAAGAPAAGGVVAGSVGPPGTTGPSGAARQGATGPGGAGSPGMSGKPVPGGSPGAGGQPDAGRAGAADRGPAGGRSSGGQSGWGARGGAQAGSEQAVRGAAGQSGAGRFAAGGLGNASSGGAGAGHGGFGGGSGAGSGGPGGSAGAGGLGGGSAGGGGGGGADSTRGVPTAAEEALGKGRSAGAIPPGSTAPNAVGPGFAAVRTGAGLSGLAEAAPALGAAGAGGALAGDDGERRGPGRNNAGNRIHQIPMGDLPEEEEARLARRGGHTPDAATTRSILEPAAPQDGEEASGPVRRFGVEDNDLFADRRDVSPDTIGEHDVP